MNTKALKQKILDLAIHGKLVAQNPDDESASVLLEKIRAEKAKLVAEKKMKADKKDSFIFVGDDDRHYEKFADGTVKDIEDEIPFELPEGWAWCRLPSICRKAITDGTHNSPPTCDKGDFLYITAKNIKSNKIDLSNVSYVTKEVHEEIYNRCPPELNDVLLTKDGTIGEVAVNNLQEPFSLLSSVALIKPSANVLPWFIAYVLKSDYLQSFMRQSAKGVALKRIILEQINTFLIPVPPLAEQQRIVSAIQSIFSKIDTLEQNKSDLQTAIKQAKSKILDLAIHGKLVAQNPDDESASELLEKIRAEKAKLVAEKKMKVDKKDSFIFVGDDNRHYEKFADGTVKDIEDEIPFELPEGWAWCRLKDVCELKGGKRIPAGLSATKEKTGHIYIRVTDMQNNSISDTDLVYITDDIFEKIQRYTIGKDDLYLTIAGTIGRVGEVPEKFDGMNLTENALKLTNISICKKYLMRLLNTKFVQDYFESTYHQVAMPKLSLINASKTIIPLPPLAEQKRIAWKIEALFARLEAIADELAV